MVFFVTGKQRAASAVLNAFEDLDVDADNQADENVEELLCIVHSNVVGMQYYSGQANTNCVHTDVDDCFC